MIVSMKEMDEEEEEGRRKWPVVKNHRQGQVKLIIKWSFYSFNMADASTVLKVELPLSCKCWLISFGYPQVLIKKKDIIYQFRLNFKLEMNSIQCKWVGELQYHCIRQITDRFLRGIRSNIPFTINYLSLIKEKHFVYRISNINEWLTDF